MVDQALLPAIEATIRQNEIGNTSPYQLSFARKGQSGASFGFMQGDTNVSSLARATLTQVLAAAGVDQGTYDPILAALSHPLPNGDPLSIPDTALVNNALSAPTGRPIVDAMDQALLGVVLTGLDSCVAAASAGGLTLAPIAFLYIAPWINMSGAPHLLNTWLGGAAVHGVPPPTPPTVNGSDVAAYLQSMAYFQANPRNFAHFEQCVQAGAAQLPPA